MRNWLLAGTAFSLSLPNLAFAQGSNETGDVDTIIVTATKREERLVDVPVSLVATSGEDLEERNFTAATDLQYTTPGLQLGDSNTPRGAGLRIRGVGTNVFADGIEQSVGTVVDGVPLARAGQGLADLVDIERVEVLRGPQGMLFGRNASAGLINIITRQPTDELEIRANAAAGSDGLLNLSAAISGPLGGSGLRGRISAYSNERDPLVNRAGEGASLNGRNEHGFRGALAWDVTDNFEVVLRGDWSKRDNDCCVWTPRAFADASTDPRPGIGFLSSALPDVEAGPENLTIGQASGEYFNEVISSGFSLEANWDIGGHTITSITGARTWEQEDQNDADLSPLNILDRNFGANDLDQFSQEIRVTSPSGQRFEYVAGVFYYESTNEGDFEQVGRFSLALAQAQAANVDIPLAPGLALPAAQLFGRTVSTTIDVRDIALFGQGTFEIVEGLDLVFGARYTDTAVEIDYARTGTPGADAFNFILGAAFAPYAFASEVEDDDLSWQVGLRYALDEDSNVYGTITEGYKGPGFNNLLDLVVPTGTDPGEFSQVAPEIPLSYEVGYKGQLFDDRVLLSLALFHTTFDNFQAQVVERDESTGLNRFAIRNAGELVTQGFEAETSTRLTDHLSIGLGISFIDTEFEDFQGAACPRLGAVVTEVGAPCGPTGPGEPNAISFDASGLSVNNAPELTWNVNADYERPIFGNASGFARVAYYWRDDTTYGLYPDNIDNPTVQESFGRLDASFGATFADGRATLSVFGQNLLEEDFVTSIFDLPFDGAGGLAQFTTWDAQRTIGISLGLVY